MIDRSLVPFLHRGPVSGLRYAKRRSGSFAISAHLTHAVRDSSLYGGCMQPTRERLVFSTLAVFTGFLAALAIPGRAAGLNLVLVGGLLLVAVGFHLRDALRIPDFAFLAASAWLFAAFLFRSAGWLLLLDLVAALGFAAIAAVGATTWRSIVVAATGTVAGLHRGVAHVLAPLVQRVGRLGPQRRVVLRSIGVTALLLTVFGTLFMSADAAFASLAQRFLLPEVDLALLPARVAVGTLAVAVAGSLVLIPVRERVSSPWRVSARPSRFRIAPPEWISALVALDGLFGAFVVVQIGVLFGGHDRVLETAGLTYAEYARQGFFQLLVVAFLTLAVIATVVRFGEQGAGGRRWMQALLGALCLLTLVVLASAFVRMNLYQDTFGFTRLRIAVDATIIWLAAVFAAVLVAGATWKGSWLPRAVLCLSALALIGLNLYDPDARIASLNIARFERTGRVDVAYLTSLSPDAVPALRRLPEPQRGCVLGLHAARLSADGSLWSFNLARERARILLEQEPAPSEGVSYLLGCSMARPQFPAGGQSGLRKGS